jgi:hypothetical protein
MKVVVGEHGVVAVGGEQLALTLGCRVIQAFHAAHDQAGGDLLGTSPASAIRFGSSNRADTAEAVCKNLTW